MLGRWEVLLLNTLPAVVQARLRGAHAANKAIVRSAFWLMLFVLAAKLVAAGKEMAVAYRYGTSATVEGYLFVFNLPSWPVTLLFSVMSAVFIPRRVALQRDEPDAAVPWQRQVTTWVWLQALALGVVSATGLPLLLATGWLSLESAALAAAQAVLPWLAGMVTLGIVAGWHACHLMSRQRHANKTSAPRYGGRSEVWDLRDGFGTVLAVFGGFFYSLWGIAAPFVRCWLPLSPKMYWQGQLLLVS